MSNDSSTAADPTDLRVMELEAENDRLHALLDEVEVIGRDRDALAGGFERHHAESLAVYVRIAEALETIARHLDR